jgi:hypothetical protein
MELERSSSSHTVVVQPLLNPAAVAHAAPMQSHERVAAISRLVADAKARRLNCGELFCKFLGALSTLPTLGLSGLITVDSNTVVAIFRFGKLDRVINAPGMWWVAPGYTMVSGFKGTNTHKIDQLNVIDAAGNPIIVRALLEYGVVDPAAFHIATQGNAGVLFNMAEQTVRVACAALPLLGEMGHDLRSQFAEVSNKMCAELQPDATLLGVAIQRLVIVEARYAPEIAAAMLMRQQAAAQVAARKEVVAGALGIVRDTLTEYPNLSGDSRERLVSNLLVTLTSHAPTSPVLVLS